MKKKHKHHSHKKTVFIHSNSTSFDKWVGQAENIKRNNKLADKRRQKTGKI